jgi:zinc protease
MLNESTMLRSAEEMSKELEKLGSRVSVSSSNNYMNVNINTLTKQFDATMKLVKEKILQPAFVQTEFDRVKKNSIQGVQNNKKDAGYLARAAYRQLLNTENIAAMPAGGTEASLANITLDDVKAFYNTHFKPKESQLIVVSNLDKAALSKSISQLSSWKGEGPKLSLELSIPDTKKGVIYLVHKDDAAQSAIRIGKRSLPMDIMGEYYKASLMNFPLGRAFNSRINLNLREDKGYTYGARSSFIGNRLTGNFAARAAVRADVTDKSIVEFVKEISNYNEKGITNEELLFMRNAINQSEALKYETPRAKLGFLAQILEYNLTPDFVKKRTKIVEEITAEEINALAKKHLNIKEMLFVVVGNSEVLKPELEALGYEVINYEI